MTILHHPSDPVLAEFANFTLDEAAAVVVATHVAHCSRCRETVRSFEAIGGVFLEEMPAGEHVEISSADLLSLAPTFEAATETSNREPASSPVPSPTSPISAEATVSSKVDRLIGLYAAGPWRWLGPGTHWRTVSAPSEQGIRVFMLRARAGTALPHHSHSGIEWTCVLEGAFEHSGGRFGPSDFDEADASVDHDPVVTKDGVCVCIVAMTGKLKLQGALGRLLQPFVRI